MENIKLLKLFPSLVFLLGSTIYFIDDYQYDRTINYAAAVLIVLFLIDVIWNNGIFGLLLNSLVLAYCLYMLFIVSFTFIIADYVTSPSWFEMIFIPVAFIIGASIAIFGILVNVKRIKPSKTSS
ncbi:MAG: hypothetical protein ACEPOV_09330 [Hyphomicrobiales bacterium]